ncbi:MAG: methyltransferase [Leptospiraceae bacterium]|nr:methyltransferase [Leptospiraceae bacterium]
MHKIFTFVDGFSSFFAKFFKFSFYGNLILLFRIFFFYIGSLLFNNPYIPNVLSIIFIVLINFVIFDRFIFNPSTYRDDIDNPYDSEGSGIQTLETIEEARNYNKWIAEKFEDYLGEHNLEIGAGRGTISAIISEKFPLEVFEIAEDNVAFLQKRFANNKNIKAVEKDFLECNKYSHYDCIYSSNVLEHIEEDGKFLFHSMKLLKTGGFFIAVVPAMPLLYSKFDSIIGHVRRYSKKDLSRFKDVLQQNGFSFKIIKYRYFNPIGAFGWFIKMKLMNNTVVKKSDAMTMNAILPFVSFLDYIPFPFGQSLWIVIKKI